MTIFLSHHAYAHLRRSQNREVLFRPLLLQCQPVLYMGEHVKPSNSFPWTNPCESCHGSGEGSRSTYCRDCHGAGAVKIIGARLREGVPISFIYGALPKAFTPYASFRVPPPRMRGLV